MTPQLDAIGLVVSDMEASLAFYRLLGLDPSGEDHVEATLPGGMRLMWDTLEVIRSFDPSWEQPVGPGRISLAFRCESPAEVDATYHEAVEAGHRGSKEPWDAFWGQRYAELLDPDGNAVQLYAPL
jgi:catechol 2,3-dioxygenase-like lactoylglutathione lyase family enzyme